jgi:hypothetical protein
VAAPAVIVEASLRLHLEHTRQRVARLLHHGVHHGGAPAYQDSGEDTPDQDGDQASFRFHSLRFQVHAPDQKLVPCTRNPTPPMCADIHLFGYLLIAAKASCNFHDGVDTA